jgi:hypothetical protein
LRAKLAFAARRGRDGPPLLLAAAQRLAPIDAALARETYLEALMYSMIVGRFSAGERCWPVSVAREAQLAPPAVGPPTAVDLLLDGLIARYTDGYVAAHPCSSAQSLSFSGRTTTRSPIPDGTTSPIECVWTSSIRTLTTC